MTGEIDQRRSFYEFVIARGGQRRLIGTSEETELVSKAVFELGLPAFEAKGLILSGAAALDAAVETTLDRSVEVLVVASADRWRRIGRPEFRQLVRYVQTLAKEGLGEAAAERKVKDTVSRLGLKPRPVGPPRSVRWYRRAGRSAASERVQAA
jgi:hypothetical protein